MVSKLDYVPNLPWDIPGWIWDMITFGTSIYLKSEVRFGTYEIRIPVWDIPKLIWDIGSIWATTSSLCFFFYFFIITFFYCHYYIMIFLIINRCIRRKALCSSSRYL